uniref:Uncharacterized protein n=1 Tax=Oryza nivara TaxID=4536 RepID=A0A0E0JB59_ORYNI
MYSELIPRNYKSIVHNNWPKKPNQYTIQQSLSPFTGRSASPRLPSQLAAPLVPPPRPPSSPPMSSGGIPSTSARRAFSPGGDGPPATMRRLLQERRLRRPNHRR